MPVYTPGDHPAILCVRVAGSTPAPDKLRRSFRQFVATWKGIDMSFTTHIRDDVAVIQIDGRFDAQSAPPIAEWLEEIAATTPGRVVVDLVEASFLDSSALAVLVRAVKRCRMRGGDVRLSGVPQSVRLIFELTRLDRAFDMFADQDEAVRSF
jgi:anti-sigma B factor antagonist